MSGPHPDPLSDMLSKPHELDGRFEREAKTVTTSQLICEEARMRPVNNGRGQTDGLAELVALKARFDATAARMRETEVKLLDRISARECRQVIGHGEVRITALGPLHRIAIFCARRTEPGAAWCAHHAIGKNDGFGAGMGAPSEGLRRAAVEDGTPDVVEMIGGGR